MTDSESTNTTPNLDAGLRVCPECRVGNLQASAASFFTDVAGNMMTIPDFPAWICDICGHCEYDRDSLNQLQTLLSTDHHTGLSASRVSPSSEAEPRSKGAEPPITA